MRWADVTDARDGDGVLLTVRTSKTNQEGDAADVRYLKNGAANAIRTVRADRPDAAPTDRVVGLSPVQIQRRFTAAARAAGIEARVTAHSLSHGTAAAPGGLGMGSCRSVAIRAVEVQSAPIHGASTFSPCARNWPCGPTYR